MSTEGEKRVLATMRRVAWHRAQGELNAMLETYWGGAHCDPYETQEYEKVRRAIVDFRKFIEGEIL